MEIASELPGAAIMPGGGGAAATASAVAAADFAALLQPAAVSIAGRGGQPAPAASTIPPSVDPALSSAVQAPSAAPVYLAGRAAASPPLAMNLRERVPPAVAALEPADATVLDPSEERGASDPTTEPPQPPAASVAPAGAQLAPQPPAPLAAGMADAEVPGPEKLDEPRSEPPATAPNDLGGALPPLGPPETKRVGAELPSPSDGHEPTPVSLPPTPSTTTDAAVAFAPARSLDAELQQIGSAASSGLEPGEPPAAAFDPITGATSATLAPASFPAPTQAAEAAASKLHSSAPATRPGLTLGNEFGERLGLAITGRLGEGAGEVQIRMDPAELGRIHVRLSFDEGGSLRAVVGADSPQVLDAIRRDAGELGRTLAEAGVRTDAQSFRFDRGSHGGGGELPRPWRHGQDNGGEQPAAREDEPRYRPLRSTGRVDLMA